ncbi:MAG TPA: flagellar biosynthetic protein FliO [Pseudobdellovibrionaceae bacterium]|nr:flagellar biosynthetic protein FliO [Pseudobdellovibrionaceae bacterium]
MFYTLTFRHFMAWAARLFVAISIFALALPASAASVQVSRDSDSSSVRILVQLHEAFSGTDAMVFAADPQTVEVRIPGARVLPTGQASRQLARFEDEWVRAVSTNQDAGTGIVRFSLKNRLAAQAAEVMTVGRAGEDARALVIHLVNVGADSTALVGQRQVAINELPADEATGLTAASTASPADSSREIAPTLVAGQSATRAPAVDPLTPSESMATKTDGSQKLNVNSAKTERQNEAEIPVFGKSAKEAKVAPAASSLERLVVTVLVLTVLVAAAAFALKNWSRRRNEFKDRVKMQVISQHFLGPKKSLAVIQVAGEALLIGVTDHNITLLKTLSFIDDEVPELAPKNFADELESHGVAPYSGASNKLVGASAIRRESHAQGASATSRAASFGEDQNFQEFDESENFAVKALDQIRDMVSTRVRGMKDLE